MRVLFVLFLCLFLNLFTGCGVPQLSPIKIVGGSDLSAEHALSQSIVAIISSGGTVYCTGTIISERQIITAAHCVEQVNSVIYVGFGLSFEDGDDPSDDIDKKVVHGIVYHKKYDESRLPNSIEEMEAYPLIEDYLYDIAVIQLQDEIPETYRPLKLLEDEDLLVEDAVATLVGYGVTDLEAEDWGTLRSTSTFVAAVYTHTAEVRSQSDGLGAACFGDSGGPLLLNVVDEESQELSYLIVGITSRSTCTSGGHHSHISQYSDWISEARAKLDSLARDEFVKATI